MTLVPEKRAPRPLTVAPARTLATQPGPNESADNREEKRYKRFVQSVFSADVEKEIHEIPKLHTATAWLYHQSLMNRALNPEMLDIIKGHWRPFRFALDVNNNRLIAELIPHIDTKKLYKLMGEGVGRVNTIVVDFMKHNIRAQWAQRWAQRGAAMQPHMELARGQEAAKARARAEEAAKARAEEAEAEARATQLQRQREERLKKVHDLQACATERRQAERAHKFKLDAMHLIQSQLGAKAAESRESSADGSNWGTPDSNFNVSTAFDEQDDNDDLIDF